MHSFSQTPKHYPFNFIEYCSDFLLCKLCSILSFLYFMLPFFSWFVFVFIFEATDEELIAAGRGLFYAGLWISFILGLVFVLLATIRAVFRSRNAIYCHFIRLYSGATFDHTVYEKRAPAIR